MMPASKPTLYVATEDDNPVVVDLQENYLTGYIKLFRSIRKHWIWQDANKLKWWLDILLECNHEDKKVNIGFELFDCKRGQSLHSLLEWSKRWRADKSTVKRFLDLLQADGMIKLENLKKTTRLTVCKYGTYNDKRNATETRRNSDTTQTQHEQECKELKEDNTQDKKSKIKYRPNVQLLPAEHDRLVKELGAELTESCYDFLSDYKKEKGYKTKDDNLTIRRWVIKAVNEKKAVQSHPVNNTLQPTAFNPALKNRL